MKVKSEKDFQELRNQFSVWRRRFPMFRHDVNRIEDIIEKHIQYYSIALVFYRQTHREKFLDDARAEIESINRVLELVGKMEMMALLSQG
jgi:predicted  nucleic acid-binding Zn-ribbon protein